MATKGFATRAGTVEGFTTGRARLALSRERHTEVVFTLFFSLFCSVLFCLVDPQASTISRSPFRLNAQFWLILRKIPPE